MNFELTLAKKAFVLIAVPLLFQFVFIAYVFHLIEQAEHQHMMEARSRDVMEQANEVLILIFDKLSGDLILRAGKFEVRTEIRRKAREEVVREVDKLKALVSDSRSKTEVCERLLTAVKTPIEELDHKELTELLKKRMIHVQMAVDELMSEIIKPEYSNKKHMQKLQQETQKQLGYLLFFGLLFNTFVAVTLAIVFNRSTSSRMNSLVDNTRRFAAKEELLPALRGADELAELDSMFRQMATSINEAITRESAIVDNALDVICTIAEDGKLIDVNPATESLWGFEADELRGAHVVKIIDGDNLAEFLDRVESTKTEEVSTTFEFKVKRKDGTFAPTSWAVRWSPVDQLYYCVAHDFTEREKVDNLRRELVAMASHDLKAPLTSIQLNLNLISSGACGELTDELTKRVGTAERNTVRLLKLINDLLDLEKMEQGKFAIDKGNCNLADLVSKAIDTISGEAEGKKVSVKTRAIDCEIEADPERITQVLVNFLSNAVKFSPSGSVIEVFSEKVSDGVKVSVSDSGPGISEEVLPTIFSRFGKVEKADSNLKGTGLGLAIARAIVDAHDGEIGVDSEAGRGTTFWFVV